MKSKLTQIFAETAGISITYNHVKNSDVNSRHITLKSDKEYGLNFSFIQENLKSAAPATKACKKSNVHNSSHTEFILLIVCLFFGCVISFITNLTALGISLIIFLFLDLLFIPSPQDNCDKPKSLLNDEYEIVIATVDDKWRGEIGEHIECMVSATYKGVRGIIKLTSDMYDHYKSGDIIEAKLISRYNYRGELIGQFLVSPQ